MRYVDLRTTSRDPVYAYALVERSRQCWLLVIPRCPFCGRGHQHGGGPLDEDPRRYLSGRVPHCANSFDDAYVLTGDPALQGQVVPDECEIGGAA